MILVIAIFFIGKAAGIIGGETQTDNQQEQNTDTTGTDEDGMVTVPNLVGKTEDEAAALLERRKAGQTDDGEKKILLRKKAEFLHRIFRPEQK